MSEREAPRGIDTSVAHSARIYDWWLGGKDNFAADRELGQKIVDLVPMTPGSARANRAFLHRAAEAVAREGVHRREHAQRGAAHRPEQPGGLRRL